jgi:2',3'-cyclic-nucleotide 2'-phosphodiesterase (5'-nucleotidase family)
MLIGNIEFTFGQERLKELAAESDFPFLSSNIHESGTEHTPSYISPELILTPGRGLKIGIVGITPPNTPDLTSKGNVLGLDFLPPDSSLKKRIANLRQASADLVVLLTLYDKERISPNEWTAIADAQPDICVMLDYQVDNTAAIMKDGIIVKTVSGYNKSKEVDVLDLELSSKPTKILSFAGRRIAVNHGEIDPDKKVQEIIDSETRQVGSIKEKVIGSFAGDYKRMFSEECPIANMIADAMRDSTGAEIAIQNSGGIQNNIQEGEMTFGDLFNVMPFDNQLVTMNLSGSDLMELFTNSASIRRGILQVSGCSYKFANRGFNDYDLKEVLLNGSPIVATETYNVTTNSFLADGGDNFLAFKRGRNLRYGLQLRDAVQKYIKKQSQKGPIELSVEGRVVRTE